MIVCIYESIHANHMMNYFYFIKVCRNISLHFNFFKQMNESATISPDSQDIATMLVSIDNHLSFATPL